MPRSKDREVDYQKLKGLLKAKGFDPGEASVKLGYSNSFLSHACSTGRLATSAVVAIESVFGIAYDEYKPEPKPEPEPLKANEPPTVPTVTTMSVADKLAVKEVVESVDGLRNMIYLQKEQIKALTDVLDRIAQKVEKLDAVASDPTALYKALFIPIYNAIRTADIDGPKEQPRRIDGTPLKDNEKPPYKRMNA